MPSNMKKYLITAVTLGLIAAGGALLIAGTNMLTKDRIAANEVERINKGFKTIYGVDELSYNTFTIEGSFEYVNSSYYEINDKNDVSLGFAFRTEGYNSYGKITLIVGFTSEYTYKGLSVVANEQSFASTLNKKYLDPLMEGERELDDVSCGATYGAKLVRDMVNEAKSAAESLKGVKNG